MDITENCPPESGGQRDREEDPARGGSIGVDPADGGFGTTPRTILDFVSIVLPS